MSGYFDAAYFGAYFDTGGVTPPVPPVVPEHHGGGRQQWRKTSVVRDWLVEQDDEELMFWII